MQVLGGGQGGGRPVGQLLLELFIALMTRPLGIPGNDI
jgi:hypothetical protein